MRILVSGMAAAAPNQGGVAWAVMSYLLGLQKLGHEVWYVEIIEPDSVQPRGAPLDRSTNATWCKTIMAQCGLRSRWTLGLRGTQQTVGLTREDARGVAQRCDVLLNLVGSLTEPELFDPIVTKIYVDLDPAFVQLWHFVDDVDMRFEGHTHFITVGQAIGTNRCSIPTGGLEWIKTFPPVFLPEWEVSTLPHTEALTTVAHWRSYGSIHHNGMAYGQKAHSLRALLSLPERAGEHFLLALAIHPDERTDIEALARHGWEIVDPVAAAGSPELFHRFVQRSMAEFGVAKSGYVTSRCGWFSERSAAYLASGRPVIAQETGFSDWLPTGEGLLAFSDTEEAADAVHTVRGDYERHRRAARALAETYFDSDRVLTKLLEQVGVTG